VVFFLLHTAHGKIDRVTITHKIKTLIQSIRRLSLRTKIIIGVSVGVVLSYGLIFGIPKGVSFSYSGETCVRQLTLAPSISQSSKESGYDVTLVDPVVIGGATVASLKTCFEPTDAPVVGTTRIATAPFGGWFAAKQFAITVDAPPTAQLTDFVGKTLPVTRPVEVKLSQADEVFSYKLKIADDSVDCAHRTSVLSCDIEPLELAQGETFDATLVRFFKDTEVHEVGQGKITTLRALTLVSSSVAEGQEIFEKPASFSFEYDKPIETVKATLKVKNGETFEPVEVTTSADGNKAVITPKAELKRSAWYEITLQEVDAVDGSATPAEYKVLFSLSGGPKVTGVSVGTSGVNLAGSITVSFDQEVTNVDSIQKLVVVSGLDARVSKSGKNIIITYSGAARCGNFSIQVKKGLESQYGVVQENDWTFNSRTLCYTVSTYGTSKQGRALNAYYFGSGGKTILYTGSIHGNEHSSRLLMNNWIDELDANVQNIPTGVRIVVVPSVNPDGMAANTRTNANNVDLNRNYNTSDWKQDVETVNGDPFPGGGGSAPGSEPETQSLMSLTSSLRPSLTMSYHSSASYAIANTCGASPSLAATYAKLSGYRNMTGVSGAFTYQITGTYDDWICERLGLASVLIELATSTSAEFSRNKAALWAMARS